MSIHQVEQVLLFDSNMFVIDGERPILVDSGTGFKVETTIASVREILGGRDPEYIVLTHRHFDHVGGAKAIADATGAELFAGTMDAAPLREGDSESTLGTDFRGRIDPMTITDLNEGDRLDTGEHTLRVIETPGHTIGSISLYDDESKDLFSGDTLFFKGVGRYDTPTASRDDLVGSLRKIHSLSAEALYPGHGPCWSGDVREQAVYGLRMLGENA